MAHKSIVYERVELARSGKNPMVISKLSSGWLVLGDNQNIPGYCVFMRDPLIEEIHRLTLEERTVFLTEMTVCGDAIKNVTAARLINYSILGNADAGLHAHIHPRYEWEDEKYRTKNPFKYYWENVPEVKFDLTKHEKLMRQIREEIKRIIVGK